MGAPKGNAVKVYLTKKEVVALAGILGGMYGEIFGSLYDTLVNHLQSEDEEIADEISNMLTNRVELNEDNLLYEATIKVKGNYHN